MPLIVLANLHSTSEHYLGAKPDGAHVNPRWRDGPQCIGVLNHLLLPNIYNQFINRGFPFLSVGQRPNIGLSELDRYRKKKTERKANAILQEFITIPT